MVYVTSTWNGNPSFRPRFIAFRRSWGAALMPPLPSGTGTSCHNGLLYSQSLSFA